MRNPYNRMTSGQSVFVDTKTGIPYDDAEFDWLEIILA
jgi:hypothetical protein